MGNSIGNANKKSTEKAKMIRQRKNSGICWDEKEKATQVKQTIQHEDINQEGTGERRKVERY